MRLLFALLAVLLGTIPVPPEPEPDYPPLLVTGDEFPVETFCPNGWDPRPRDDTINVWLNESTQMDEDLTRAFPMISFTFNGPRPDVFIIEANVGTFTQGGPGKWVNWAGFACGDNLVLYADCIDLWGNAVVIHEMGHILGLGHTNETWMAENIYPGHTKYEWDSQQLAFLESL